MLVQFGHRIYLKPTSRSYNQPKIMPFELSLAALMIPPPNTSIKKSKHYRFQITSIFMHHNFDKRLNFLLIPQIISPNNYTVHGKRNKPYFITRAGKQST